jgi:menaquinol-cytochrome c reductase iron-sulfur subunit
MNAGIKLKAGETDGQRRSFLVRFTAVVVGGLVAIFPFAAGLGVLLNPLRGRGDGVGKSSDDDLHFVRIGPLDLLPADGTPRQFTLTADVVDAWTHSPGQRVGSAFLSRSGSEKEPAVTALSSACPHLGCAVDFVASADQFQCPCHESAFAQDGKRLFGPSLRGLDPLPVKLVEANGQMEIWVAPEKFRTGIAERVRIG